MVTVEPRLLDLYCCQGGASAGYAAAGFAVTGVDIDPQPRYPYRFFQADALVFLRERMRWIRDNFHAVHASPPCQRYSRTQVIRGREHPDLVGPTRDLLDEIGLPWVIENVMEAPLNRARSIVLCGGMFGLRTYRHRRFEPSPGFTLIAPERPKHTVRTAHRGRREAWDQGLHASITGDIGIYVGPEAMGIDWMTGNGLSEAIPVPYAEWVGVQLMKELTR